MSRRVPLVWCAGVADADAGRLNTLAARLRIATAQRGRLAGFTAARGALAAMRGLECSPDVARLLWFGAPGRQWDALAELCAPSAHRFARSCYSTPDLAYYRARVVAEAAGFTCGIEYAGDRRDGEPVQYANAGDGYAETLIFSGRALRVGCWADLIESGAVRPREL